MGLDKVFDRSRAVGLWSNLLRRWEKRSISAFSLHSWAMRLKIKQNCPRFPTRLASPLFENATIAKARQTPRYAPCVSIDYEYHRRKAAAVNAMIASMVRVCQVIVARRPVYGSRARNDTAISTNAVMAHTILMVSATMATP